MLLRSAEPEDSLAVARVHVRSWQVGYRGLLPDEYLDHLNPEERARHYKFGATDPLQPATIVAVEQREICGFATTAAARDPDATGKGELYALYVDPSYWGRGIGAALVTAARSRLAEQRFSAAVLWLLSGNSRGDRFYRIDGWLPDGTQRIAEVWGVSVEEFRYHRALP